MADNTALNPPTSLQASVPATITAVGKIDAAVKKLEAIPDTSSSVAPNLAAHIKTAKQHGEDWTSKVRPSIVAALDGVAAYGTEFDKQYEPLLAAAKKLDGGGTDAIQGFKALLAKLQGTSTIESNKVASEQGAINSFNGLVAGDARAFNADVQQATVAHKTAMAAAVRAEQTLRKLEEEYAKKKAILESLSILSVFAAALVELLKALGVKMGVTREQLRHASQAVEQAEQAISVAQQAVAATSDYQTTAGSIATAVNSMMDGWETMDGNFNTLLQSEQISSFNVFTQDVLTAVKLDWDNLATQAKTLG